MNDANLRPRMPLFLFALTTLLLLAPGYTYAQRGGRGGDSQAGPPPTAKAAAPIDITGYWVSLVTDNWIFRVITPAKSDYRYLPINPEGRRVADTWDPAKDEASGNQCKGYGPVGVMRMPGRLHVTWENDNTLRIDTDTGTQTRLFHFGASQEPAQPSLQGYSVAQWELPGGGRGGRGRGGQGATAPQTRPGSSLKVVTTHMTPGYLQKNGIPYGGNAVLTEYFMTIEDKGVRYLAVTTMLDDPQYLTQSFVRTSQFKKLPDAAGWNPTPCSAR